MKKIYVMSARFEDGNSSYKTICNGLLVNLLESEEEAKNWARNHLVSNGALNVEITNTTVISDNTILAAFGELIAELVPLNKNQQVLLKLTAEENVFSYKIIEP